MALPSLSASPATNSFVASIPLSPLPPILHTGLLSLFEATPHPRPVADLTTSSHKTGVSKEPDRGIHKSSGGSVIRPEMGGTSRKVRRGHRQDATKKMST